MNAELVRADELKTEVAPVVQNAMALEIRTPADYESAANSLKLVKGAIKRIDDWFAPLVRANLEATRATNAKKAEVRDPLVQAEQVIKRKQLDWSMEQERARKAEEDRLNAIAAEKARKEREKQEAAARQQREREEQARREAEEARRKAAESKNAEERARLQREAEASERAAAAAAAKAEAKEEAAAAVQQASVTVASRAPEIKGQSIRKVWRARITDARPAAAALLQYLDWEAYIEINQGQLDKLAQRTKGALKIEGIEFYEDAILASSSR